MNLKNKKILFIISNEGFRDEELFEPRRILESYGARTVIASKELKTCVGVLGKTVNTELKLESISISDYDAIVLVGGAGSIIYYNDKKILDLVKESFLKGKLVCAICLASGILAHAGIVKNHKIAGFETTKELIEKAGGIYSTNGVEQSSRIISAQGPKYVKEFGELIAKALDKKL